MVALLGINSISVVEDRIMSGDKQAEFYLEAMCYQIAKDIGAMATVLKGKVFRGKHVFQGSPDALRVRCSTC